MKKARKYTITEKRKQNDIRSANWEKRLEIFILRNQGWKFAAIAKKLGCTRQFASFTYNKIKNMTVEEINKLANAN